MINLFDISNRTVVPSSHCYVIPWLKRIMDIFTDNYLEIYSYVFYLTCPDVTINPYANQPETERESIIISDLKPTFDLEDPIIISTIEWCKKMYETPTLHMWKAQKKMVEKVGKYLDQTEITEGKDSNAMAIDRFMKQGLEYVEILNKMGNILKEEQAKVRGNTKLRYDFMPGYIDSKADKDDE